MNTNNSPRDEAMSQIAVSRRNGGVPAAGSSAPSLPASFIDAATMEKVLLMGDLSQLTNAQRLAYYESVCRSMNLNMLTRPFEYIRLNGKLVLYARKDCTDQLRKLNDVSITNIDTRIADNILTVIASACTAKGRTDTSIGAASLENLRGEALANAMMKTETKAKRRVTLSIVGLGSFLDESEVDSIPTAIRVSVNESGEIVGEIKNAKPIVEALPEKKDAVPETESIKSALHELADAGVFSASKSRAIKSFADTSTDIEKLRTFLGKTREEYAAKLKRNHAAADAVAA
jgi:hypothetical protein